MTLSPKTGQPFAQKNLVTDTPRRSSPSAGRNRADIAVQLAAILPRNAHVLEIASGTGEHALACLGERPDLDWQPTDIDPDARASINSWRLDNPTRMAPALPIDTTAPHWWGGLDQVDAVFCANMIHIAPWEAALGLASGAGHLLRPGGLALLYGPFGKGADTAPSNHAFTESLQSRNPLWGVRELADVKAIFAKSGLALMKVHPMPANNDLLIFAAPG